MDRIALQNAEFDALHRLIEVYDIHGRVAVVDDDYPYVRQRYETVLQEFLRACAANGRTLPKEVTND